MNMEKLVAPKVLLTDWPKTTSLVYGAEPLSDVFGWWLLHSVARTLALLLRLFALRFAFPSFEVVLLECHPLATRTCRDLRTK